MTKHKTFLTILLVAAGAFSSFTNAQDDQSYELQTKKGRPDLPGLFLIEFGYNILSDAPSSMDMTLLGSRSLNLYYFRDFQIGNTGLFALPGVGVGLDRYKFDNNVTLSQSADVNGDTFVSVDTLGFGVDKSMLITNYIDIPFELRYYLNPDDRRRSFMVGVGAKAGYLFGSHTKLKFDDNGETRKIKDKRGYELSQFRYGITGRLGFGGFNLIYFQRLNELFDGNGPEGTMDTSNFTIGLSFTGF